MTTTRRFYRDGMGRRFRPFTVAYRETDLWIGVDPESYRPSMETFAAAGIRELRWTLESYAARRRGFLESLVPLEEDPGAPRVAHLMVKAAVRAGVGPMAAVAGAFARCVGEDILARFAPREIVVENGGDIWLNCVEPVDIAVYAGSSPLSGRVGVSVPPDLFPCGICTSSGTVGPSLSFGVADAAMILCADAALADAWATAAGNMVRSAADLERAVEAVRTDPDVFCVLLVAGDRMCIGGRLPPRFFRPSILPQSLQEHSI